MAHAAGVQLAIDEGPLASESEDRQVETVFESMRRSEILGPWGRPDHFRRLHRVWRSLGRANAAWSFEPRRFRHPVLLLRASDPVPDALLPREALRGDPYRAWETFSTVPLRLKTVPGDHLSIVKPPRAAAVARALAEALDEAEA
mgnify:FL=1